MAGFISSLNETETIWFSGWLMAPAAGIRLVTCGAGEATVMKFQYRGRPVGTDPFLSSTAEVSVTTYGVPGVWLSVWLAQLQKRRDDEAETILSVEVA